MQWLVAVWLLQPAEPNATQGEANVSAVTAAYLENLMSRLRADGKREARALLASGDYAGALAALRELQALDEGDSDLHADLATTYHRLGNATMAERHYRRALEDARPPLPLWVGYADLLIERGGQGIQAAARLLVRAREAQGNMHALILRQARLEALLGNVERAEQYYEQARIAVDVSDDGIRQALLELGDLYRDMGRPLDALAVYRQIEGPEATSRSQEIDIAMQARRFGWGRPAAASDRVLALFNRARTFVERRRFKEALAVLGEVQSLDPTYAAAWMVQGDIAATQGHTRDAENAYLRSLAMDQGSIEAHEKLAQIYRQEKRFAEAALLLERAVQLDPERRSLRLQLAQAQRENGQLVESLASVESYLADPQDGAPTLQAQLLRAALRSALEAPAASASAEPASDLPQRMQRVRALLARGETDAAMTELDAAIVLQPAPSLLNLRARVLRGAGQQAAAVASYTESLAIDPEQAGVCLELGQMAEEQGDLAAAGQHYASAARLGDSTAGFFRARLRTRRIDGEGPWAWRARLRARGELAAYVASSPDGEHVETARALMAGLDRRLVQFGMSVAVVALGVSLAAGGLLWRRFGGATLASLVARAPDVVPDVQHLVAAIRHEILKHNALAVAGLVSALERGEGTGDQGVHVASSVGDGEVLARLNAYLSKLVDVGRGAGVRMNLRREPAFVALHKGLAMVKDLRSQLVRVESLPGYRRRWLLRRLRVAAQLLSDGSFRRLEGMLRHIQVLVVDESLLRSIYARICREPALLTLRAMPLRIEVEQGLPSAVAMRRRDFEDVVGNLMRNAIQASAGLGAVRIGVRVTTEQQAVTGLDDLVLQICDDASEFSAERIATADPTAGLGLARELAQRYEGRLDVRSDVPGWRKAVVFRLPSQEILA